MCLCVCACVCVCGPVGLREKKYKWVEVNPPSLPEVRNKRNSALCRPSVPLWEKLSSSLGQRGEGCSARLQPRADLTAASLPGNYSRDREAAPTPLALCTTHTHTHTERVCVQEAICHQILASTYLRVCVYIWWYRGKSESRDREARSHWSMLGKLLRKWKPLFITHNQGHLICMVSNWNSLHEYSIYRCWASFLGFTVHILR